MIGTTVRTSKGGEFGQLDDLIIDSKDGHIVYLVVSHAGGTEGKMVAVSFSVLSKSSENGFVMNTSKEQLEAAPAFKWSDMTNRKYAEKVYKHYGLQPYWG